MLPAVNFTAGFFAFWRFYMSPKNFFEKVSKSVSFFGLKSCCKGLWGKTPRCSLTIEWNTVIQMTILNKYIKEGCNNSICIVSNLSSHFNAYFWSARLSQLLCLMLQTVKLWEAAFLQNASHCIPYMFSFSSPSEVYSFQSLPASSGGESRNG